jgi:4a-hydroxytetrahydrobiopterin dehydratase
VTNLEKQSCETYHADSKHVSDVELKEYMKQIPNWQVIVESGIRKLKREYLFNNFLAALLFANKVGELAEAHNHHPSLLIEWGKCTVTWWTHQINGLHNNDFILAAKTDRV